MTEWSHEKRLLVAILASTAILAVWYLMFPPTPPKRPPVQAPAPQATPPPAAPPSVTAPAKAPGEPATITAASEQLIVVENALYRATFSNRGATARSWQLKKYSDDSKPPQTLDLVHAEAAQQLGGWPLAMTLDDSEFEDRANQALFEVIPAGAAFTAPAELIFRWSDGRLAVTKRLRFESSYIVELETTATLDGAPLPHGLAWRGGFGDATVYNAAALVQAFLRSAGKLQRLEVQKLGQSDHADVRQRAETPAAYAGIQDRYFAAAFLQPEAEAGQDRLALWHWRREREFTRDNKPVKEPVAEVAVGSTTPGPLALRLYVGPKDLEELGRVRPPLSELVDFGWFGFIAQPLFYFLKWTYRFVPNYGWAIVLMTLIINMALFPLKIKSFRSMQKMQKVMPEIKSIKEKYKKYTMRDPRKQQEQQELMAVWKREGINPAGGCLPMLLQMPIWFALYQMLNTAIELRHAPWIGWIKDLSARDPYYILPLTMALSMYVMQKMTPSTSPDPAQQRMMTMMPIIFGGMFVVFPVSSGLVLYILTSNLVGMGQQWYLMRSAPKDEDKGKGKKKKKAS